MASSHCVSPGLTHLVDEVNKSRIGKFRIAAVSQPQLNQSVLFLCSEEH